ncbi:hypothetical protein OIU78_023354 [Salix suchowensis]|nr:hypothetical protein OIU78_023354 [Salix suchowensis]
MPGTLLLFPEHAQESVKKLDRHSSGTPIVDRNEYNLNLQVPRVHYIITGTHISEAAESLSLVKTKLLQNKMSGNNKSYGSGAGKDPSIDLVVALATGGSMKAPGQDFRISWDGLRKYLLDISVICTRSRNFQV